MYGRRSSDMKPSAKIPKINQELFKNLPSEIIFDILLRLPIRDIAICKCVCKSSRYLLQTREFVDSHLSKSVPGLVICYKFNEYKLFEFGDEIDLEGQFEPIVELDSTASSISPSIIKGSVNGLILLHPEGSEHHDDVLYICNPINREYIEIQNKGLQNDDWFDGLVSYGFGVGKTSGEYKVVRIVQKCVRCRYTYASSPRIIITNSVCHVYTLGTGKWRGIVPPPPFGNDVYSNGAFLNGSLHWLVEDFKGSYCIRCFDLETETFSTFYLPSLLSDRGTCRQVLVVALGDHLCISDSAHFGEVVFWLMKEYGDDESWTKEFVIRKSPGFKYRNPFSQLVYPIKVFENGDVLVWQDLNVFYYSNKTKTTTKIKAYGDFDGCTPMHAMLHTPSFLSLEKSFPTEDPSDVDFKEEMSKIRKEIVNFHGEMVLLMNYSNINYTGLAKIVKRYDKGTGCVLRLAFIQRVLEQPFFATDLISKLVKECETTIESVFPPPEHATGIFQGERGAAAPGEEGIFKNTVAALMTMEEMRRGSSTYSHFSLPPLNLPDFDVIQSLQVLSPIQIP